MSHYPTIISDNDIDNVKESTTVRKLSDQKFIRKQYINSTRNSVPTQKQISSVDIIDDYDFLAQVETKKYVPVKNKNPHLEQIFKQNHHPLNRSPNNGNVSRSNEIRNKDNVSDLNELQEDAKKHVSKTTTPKTKKIDITDQLKELQIIVNSLDAKPKVSKRNNSNKRISKAKRTPSKINEIGYWQTVYSIESKQGKLLYRPRNKARNCNYTLGPCGHHQLTVQALRDIGCKSLQCRKDRLDYNKSLKLSKKLLALNEKRLKKDGLTNLQGYQKYLIHQQGANGIKNIIAATKGKKKLSKTIKKNMANNSPYSYRQFKRMGSKIAAKKFMQHWERKWMSEKRLILASNEKLTNNQRKSRAVPTFNDNDLNYALNLMF